VINNPLIFIDPTGLMYYLIYSTGSGADFTKQATYRKQQLMKCGISESDITMYSITTVNTYVDSNGVKHLGFIDAWNGMGKDAMGNKISIDDVYIFSHGNGYSLWFDDDAPFEAISVNGKNLDGGNIGDLRNLDSQDIRNLYIMTCNSGNLDIYNGTVKSGSYTIQTFQQKYGVTDNVASLMSKKTNYGMVYGVDGELSYGSTFSAIWNRVPLIGSELNYEPRIGNGNDATSNYFKLSGKRPAQGTVMYFNGQYYGYVPGVSLFTVPVY
jgi:hypothetical protein